MSVIKYLDRIKHMDELIRRKATGPPDEFAEKVGIISKCIDEIY
jgi:hypothetical protein